MDITIFKNDEFETIGIKVTTSNPGHFTPETVFAWGITSPEYYYSKKIRGDYYEKEVFALVKADMEAQAANRLMQTVTNAIMDAGIKVEPNVDEYGDTINGFCLGKSEYYTKIADQANAKVERLMKALEEAIANRNKR